MHEAYKFKREQLDGMMIVSGKTIQKELKRSFFVDLDYLKENTYVVIKRPDKKEENRNQQTLPV